MENGSASINERVENIKKNKEEISRLIQEYKPFIASVVETSIGKYVRYGEDDELSIGLIAFEEAIRSFDSTKGNFLSFAKNVIKRRLIDYYRKEKKHNKVIPLIDKFESVDDDEYDLSAQESIKVYSEKEISEFRRAEIEELKEDLKHWGLSYIDVAKSSPKQDGTHNIYLKVVECIINQPEILNIMQKKKYLTIAEIEKISKIPRKKIERGRNYIIAAVLIMTRDFQYLKSFIRWG